MDLLSPSTPNASMQTPLPTYTDAELARKLGKARQTVASALASIPPDGVKISSGQKARAWFVSSLPAEMLCELEARARTWGFRDTAELLDSKLEPWQPPIPISHVRQDFVNRAFQIRDALAQPLRRHGDLSGSALDELGLTEWKRVLGYVVTPGQWRRIFMRTLDRDRGLGEWARLELYLDDAAFLRPVTPTLELGELRRLHHEELGDIICHVTAKDPYHPTDSDLSWALDYVFRHFEDLQRMVQDKRDHRLLKKSLLEYLGSVWPGPALGKTPDAVRKSFNRDYQLWVKSGRHPKVLRDKRHLTLGTHHAGLCESCKLKFIGHAVSFGGNLALARRRMFEKEEFCPKCRDSWSFNPHKDKSHVPKSIRDQVTRLVKMVQPLHHGPKQHRMAGGYIPRDWSAVQPGDWFSADDVTWNHYFWYRDEEGRIRVTRGECLVMTDLRTGYPLGHLLIAGHYTGESIRGLVLKVHDWVGLPHIGFYFERGIWRSKLVVGNKPQRDVTPLSEHEAGLRDPALGLEIRNAKAYNPRSKPIEGLIRIWQDRMRPEPGYVGPNEHAEKFERMQETLDRARSQDEKVARQACKELYSIEQWNQRIPEILEEYAHDIQNGKMLPGRSPVEAWTEALKRRPLRKLADDARYLLATHKKPVTVRRDGIHLEIRGRRMLYCNEATGAIAGQTMLAHYSLECPDLLTICDMNHTNFLTVPRVIELPAMMARSEDLSQAHKQVGAHRRATKQLYGTIRHPIISTITRDTEQDASSLELGRFHNEEIARHRSKTEFDANREKRIRKEGAELGCPLPDELTDLDSAEEGIQLMREVMAERREKGLLGAPAAGAETGDRGQPSTDIPE